MFSTSALGTYRSPRKVWESIWNFLGQFRRTKTLQGEQTPSNYPLGGGLTCQSPYDMDVKEPVFRDVERGTQLAQMVEWSYEVSHTLRLAKVDTFGSNDGDNIGWTVSETLEDDKTKIDPDFYAAILDLVQRRNGPSMIIGGTFLQSVLSAALGYGDAFVELAIEREGIGRSDWGISKSIRLPTYTVRRCETPQGELQYFEQLQRPWDNAPIEIMPVKIVHFRHNQNRLYGTSLWGNESVYHWQWLKNAAVNIATKARSGINTRIHELPEDATPEDKQAAENDWRLLLSQGIPTDYWPYKRGTKINRIQGSEGSIDEQIKDFLQHRYRLIPSGFPAWYHPGLLLVGAKDISRQPTLLQARVRNSWCFMLSEGIRWVIDIELILKFGIDRFLEFKKNGGYRIIWPEFYVEGGENIAESDDKGIADLS